MRTTLMRTVMLAVVIVTMRVAGADAAVACGDAEGDTLWSALQTRLSVGVRGTGFRLEDRDRNPNATSAAQGSFYGSITELKARQDLWPYKFFADYLFCPYGGLELTWDRVGADTITRQDGHNDGTVIANAPLLGAFGRYPNDTGFVPYAGIGVGYAFTHFEPDYHWTHAILPNGDFKAGPDWRQSFDMRDSWSWFLYAGLSVALNANWALDLYVRHEELNLHATHSTYVGTTLTSGPTDFSLPFRNDALGIGARYSF